MPPPAKTGIRVVTLNVHFGKKTDNIVRAFTENDILRDADIIFFQEIEDHAAENISRAKKIGDALGFACAYAPARNLNRKDATIGTHGLAILSKYPIVEVETIQLPRYKLFYRTRDRIALNATIRVKKDPIRLSNVHLDTRLSGLERISQVRPLLEYLKKDKVQKIILGGDFNTYRRGQKKKLHKYLEEEGFSIHCENAGHTLKKGFVRLELDGIYLRNIQGGYCGIEHSVHISDHKPVWIDVLL
jgi:endonuclease/exonuclease/phosphatase family metal-dependent hydrolase